MLLLYARNDSGALENKPRGIIMFFVFDVSLAVKIARFLVFLLLLKRR